MKIQHWLIGGVLITAGMAVLLKESKWHRQFVDVTARKPAGRAGRRFYKDPKGHYRSFAYLLDKLALQPDEHFLDICCGGGGLLTRALRIVHYAAGLDHSADMVILTQENNPQAVAEKYLDVRQGDAGALPWADATFDVVANANALFFLPAPVKVFHEVYRVLKPGGRFALITAVKHKLVEIFFGLWSPMMTLYTDDELTAMLREAGFSDVEVYSPDGMYQIGYGVK
ncbi:MAG: class I SAM-dependent methyltransferase [Anaerolineae bacterium]|nr:class I SAM-dependent methyltransferase [Anaerolineae bacterium]